MPIRGVDSKDENLDVMRILKLLYVLSLLIFSTLPINAQRNVDWRKTIIVTTLDGTTMEYLIDKNTKVKIEKPNLVIETEGVVLTYELESMSQIRYGKKSVSNDIQHITNDDNQPFKVEDEIMFFDHLSENTLVEVFTADGKLVLSRRCSGNAQLSLSTLINGVYLVKVNQNTYKIIKR